MSGVEVPLTEAERARIAKAYGVAPGLVCGTVRRVAPGAMSALHPPTPRDLTARKYRIMGRRMRMVALLRREGRA